MSSISLPLSMGEVKGIMGFDLQIRTEEFVQKERSKHFGSDDWFPVLVEKEDGTEEIRYFKMENFRKTTNKVIGEDFKGKFSRKKSDQNAGVLKIWLSKKRSEDAILRLQANKKNHEQEERRQLKALASSRFEPVRPYAPQELQSLKLRALKGEQLTDEEHAVLLGEEEVQSPLDRTVKSGLFDELSDEKKS